MGVHGRGTPLMFYIRYYFNFFLLLFLRLFTNIIAVIELRIIGC